jgi:hypothetical protein
VWFAWHFPEFFVNTDMFIFPEEMSSSRTDKGKAKEGDPEIVNVDMNVAGGSKNRQVQPQVNSGELFILKT